jgi:hypothetical protein
VELNDIDYETNRTGFLTEKQKKKFRTQYIVYLILAVVFFACSPVGYFAYRSTGDAGPSIFLSAFCIGAGLLFVWMSNTSRKFSLRTDALVESHGGQLEMKFRGKRVHLILGGKTFTVDLRSIRGLQNGARYEFFFVDSPPKLIGWKKMQ